MWVLWGGGRSGPCARGGIAARSRGGTGRGPKRLWGGVARSGSLLGEGAPGLPLAGGRPRRAPPRRAALPVARWRAAVLATPGRGRLRGPLHADEGRRRRQGPAVRRGARRAPCRARAWSGGGLPCALRWAGAGGALPSVLMRCGGGGPVRRHGGRLCGVRLVLHVAGRVWPQVVGRGAAWRRGGQRSGEWAPAGGTPAGRPRRRRTPRAPPWWRRAAAVAWDPPRRGPTRFQMAGPAPFVLVHL